ncbi:MAG TPA: hypothetical protein ENI86_09420 [Acidimicrobiales bacterium]|nr:hypothetical protein [Acidimicrobiales bacterium]
MDEQNGVNPSKDGNTEDSGSDSAEKPIVVGDEDASGGPLFSFSSEESADLPHWSEPATGEIPVFEAPRAPDAGGSRLFPQLPDDPRMVDTGEASGVFSAVGEPRPGPESAAGPADPGPGEPPAVESTGVADLVDDLLAGTTADPEAEPPAGPVVDPDFVGSSMAGARLEMEPTGPIDPALITGGFEPDTVEAEPDLPAPRWGAAGSVQADTTAERGVVPGPETGAAATTEGGGGSDEAMSSEVTEFWIGADSPVAGPGDALVDRSDGRTSDEPVVEAGTEADVVWVGEQQEQPVDDEPVDTSATTGGGAGGDSVFERLAALPDLEDEGPPQPDVGGEIDTGVIPVLDPAVGVVAEYELQDGEDFADREPQPAPAVTTGPIRLDSAAMDNPGLIPSDSAAMDNPGPGEDQDDLDAWSSLDTGAPAWREGVQDWDDYQPDEDATARTVIRIGPEDGNGSAGLPPEEEAAGPPAGRNIPVAVATGLILAGAFLALLSRGPGYTLFLVIPLLVLATSEFFVSVRKVGYRPAALLGLASVAFLTLAAWWRGSGAIPLVLVLTTIVGLLWYLFGVDDDRPTANLSVTLLGVMWIGLLGAHIPLILALPDGGGILLGAIICTVTYDVGGLFIGRATGQSRLAPDISPNKTWEGLIGGILLVMIVAVFVLGFGPGLAPWSDRTLDAVLLGLVVSIMAPLGDLSQSLIKRDLGIKDMGSILPGHGGVFDRFDALLFVIPAVYYLAIYRDLFIPSALRALGG